MSIGNNQNKIGVVPKKIRDEINDEEKLSLYEEGHYRRIDP